MFGRAPSAGCMFRHASVSMMTRARLPSVSFCTCSCSPMSGCDGVSLHSASHRISTSSAPTTCSVVLNRCASLFRALCSLSFCSAVNVCSPVSNCLSGICAISAILCVMSISGSRSADTYTTCARSVSGSGSHVSQSMFAPSATLSAMLSVMVVFPAPVGPVNSVMPRSPYTASLSSGYAGTYMPATFMPCVNCSASHARSSSVSALGGAGLSRRGGAESGHFIPLLCGALRGCCMPAEKPLRMVASISACGSPHASAACSISLRAMCSLSSPPATRLPAFNAAVLSALFLLPSVVLANASHSARSAVSP